jgi:predicted secreted protein
MNRRRILGIVAVALVVSLVAGALTVSAQGPSKTPSVKGMLGSWMQGIFHGRGGLSEAGLQAAAKTLGVSAEELSAQLKAGDILADLADKAGVDLQAVRDAVESANQTARRDSIEQAVADGKLSREQADWMLKGLERGFAPRIDLSRAGKLLGGQTDQEVVAKALGMSVEQLSTQLWGGRTLADLAERAGVDLEQLQKTIESARTQAMRDRIEALVQQGKLTREQADWMLEGLEKSYRSQMPSRPDVFGKRGPARGGAFRDAQPQEAPANTTTVNGSSA